MKRNKLTLLLTIILAASTASGQTLTINRDECRRMAPKHSENLKKAKNVVAQSELDRKIARTAYLPKFDATASAMYMLPDIDMMDTLYSQTQTAVDAGMAIGNDLLRITAKRSELQYQKKKAENGTELCRQALCNVIGTDYDTEIEPTDTLPECAAPSNLEYDITARRDTG